MSQGTGVVKGARDYILVAVLITIYAKCTIRNLAINQQNMSLF